MAQASKGSFVGWCAATARDRVQRVRVGAILAAQAGLAAVLAWLLARLALDNPDPVFAPLVAVGTLAASVGQRVRRVVELVVGIAVGILVGDVLLYVVGTGPWQLGVVVFLAIMAALVFGGSPSVVLQAAATAVLIATLSPTVRNLEVPRFVDAFVGGGSALVVTSVLLPLNPLRVINRAARPALDMLAEQLQSTARALVDRDPGHAELAMRRLRRNKAEVQALTDAVEGAREATTLSPYSWRRRRGVLSHYAAAAEPIDRAMRNTGTLIRRSVTMIEDAEPVPEPLPDAVALLAEAVRLLRREFAGGRDPEHARTLSLEAVHRAGQAYRQGVGFSGSVVVAQVRTTASDLLVASGLPQNDANAMVREAFPE
ncbi:aromatic acid exporter family protein [Micromonospora aurantiaca]|uniref:FUSC family protein n=1 Tax=Micromonospora aurantiaca (nom. illeg.) TaxID=47850 RepID=UPI000F4169E2|nr:FUSC family protein [Micromonospora aurantiaca]RNH98181.1 aromatic acid exporter family protein [Micromonospora aurantiaca]